MPDHPGPAEHGAHDIPAAAGDAERSPAPRRPYSVTVVAIVFIAAGAIGLAYHARELASGEHFAQALAVNALRLAAIIAGAFLLRGCDWARWLALAWMAFHVGLSAWHSLEQFLMHAAILAVIAWALLRPPAAACFRRRHHAVPGAA